MRQYNSTRTGLFIVEIAFCILFLSIVAAVCVNNVVGAYEVSKDAEILNKAVIRAQSTAELYKGLRGDMQKLKDILNAQQNEEELIIHYDNSWNTVNTASRYSISDTGFIMKITTQQKNQCKISIHKLPSNESIYTINIRSLGAK